MKLPFPIELLALVINHVDNAGTLHSLLTVSRNVFMFAAPALYKSPLWPELSTANGYKLIDWLLTISPAEDEGTNMLRRIRGITPQTRQETHPIIDYLSFVTTVKWENITWWSCLSRWQDESVSGGSDFLRGWVVRSHLTTAICGHRLEHIEHLSIESENIAKYVAVASRLRNITTLYIQLESPNVYLGTCTKAVQLVEAIQKHHGRDQLQKCQLSESVFSHAVTSSSSFSSEIRAICKLHSLMPLDPAALTIPCSDGSTIVLNGPIDYEVAACDSFSLRSEAAARRYYGGLSDGRFLQRCRSHTSFNVSLSLQNVNLFEWARDEACLRDILGTKMLPPVPILDLRCRLTNQGQLSLDLRDVKDALNGFSTTLVNLWLDLVPQRSMAPSFWMLGEITRTLTRLQTIFIRLGVIVVFHPSIWVNCPNLKYLTIEQAKSTWYNINEAFEVRKGDGSWLWPVIQMSSLKELKLNGYTSSLFHPGSLHHMPCLETITLRNMQQPQWMAQNRLFSLEHRWKSTWNWSLPNLTKLDLQVDISQLCFDFKVLRGCPRLREIQIDGCGPSDQPYPLRVKPPPEGGDNYEGSTFRQQTDDIFPMLEILTLRGAWTATVDELVYLYHHMLPGLTELRLGYQFEIIGCDAREWIEATRVHPSCTLIATSYLPMTSSLEELGLVPRGITGVHSRVYHFADSMYGYLPL